MRRALVALAAVSILAAAVGAGASPADFPSPPGLQPQVRFWTRIYTEVGTDAGLIHDAYHLDVVYERVDFSDAMGGREVDARFEATKEKYREILRKLASGERENLGPEELRVLKLFPPGVSNETLRIGAESVRLQRGQADRFREGLIRSGAWEGHIERTLEKKGLPKELAALPHVESSYNPQAYSKVGAAGLWQFMPGTGRTFTLRVDSVVDERMDPFRATEAAADLLAHNYEMLGSWPLALTAYNSGAGGMARAVRDLGTNDIAEIVKRYDGPGFGFASRNFYTSFLAAREASGNAERYFGAIHKQQPIEYRVVQLEKPFSAKTLKSALGVDIETLKDHNLALRDDFWDGRRSAPAGLKVRVPKGGTPVDALAMARAERWRPQAGAEAGAAMEAGPTPPEEAAAVPVLALASQPPIERSGTILHTLRGGETVASLSRRYGVPTSVILGVNHVRDARELQPGTRLRIPALAQDSPASAPELAQQPALPAPTPVSEPVPAAAPLAEPLRVVIEPEPEPLGDVVAAMQQAEAAERAAEPAADPGAPPAAAAEDEAPLGAAMARSGPTPRVEKAERPPKPAAKPRAAPDARELARDTLDPSRYRIDGNDRITLQTDESLALVAKWLGTTPEKLRRLNKLTRKAQPGPGQKLRVDVTKSTARKFEAQRIAYHQELRNEFFDAFEVAGTEQRVVRKGDTLRTLTSAKGKGHAPVPTWLLNHYNPDVNFSALKPGKRVTIPRVEKRDS
jgi:membrane-bound lytic murein transglycosylase D